MVKKKGARRLTRRSKLLRKYFTIVFSMVFVFLVGFAMVVLGFNGDKSAQAKDKKPISNATTDNNNTETEDVFQNTEEEVNTKTNIAVFGTDKDGFRTDVNFVVSFDSETKAIALVQVPRDTKVKLTNEMISSMKQRGRSIPDIHGYGICKFGEVHAYAGIDYANEFSVKMLEDLLGIKIDYYVKVDIQGFKDIVDAIGGVDMMVEEDLNYEDPFQDLYIHLKAGYQHLDGDKAEQLVRFREGYAQKDLKRIEVQQQFMKAFIEKIVSTDTLLNNLPDLIYTAFKYVKTDFGITDALKYVKYIKDISMDNVTMETIPGEGGSFFTHDPAGTKELVDRVFYSKTVIGGNADENEEAEKEQKSVSSIGKTIEVSNGGITNGLAGKKRDMLTEKGFTVTQVTTYAGSKQKGTRIIVKEKGFGEDLIPYFTDATIEVDPTQLTNTDIKIILGLDEK